MGNQVSFDNWRNYWRILYPRKIIWIYLDVFWDARRFSLYNYSVDSDCWFCSFLGWCMGRKLWRDRIKRMVRRYFYNNINASNIFVIDTQNIFRYAALLGASFFNYAVSITGVVLLYVYYTHVRLLIIFIFSKDL